MEDSGRLKWPFYVLKLPQFSLSPMKLINCDGGTGFGVKFSLSSVQADYIYDTDRFGEEYGLVFPFTEIFLKGNVILMDYINLGKKPIENPKSLQVLEILLSFITHIEEAAKALYPVEKQSSEEEKEGRNEKDWSAILAVHYLSSLSLTQDFILNKQSSKKCTGCPCPCSCKKVIPYGDTSIGHPRSWYGHFDILMGKFGDEKGKVTEVNIGATEVPMETDDKSDTAIEFDEKSSDGCPSLTEVELNQSHNHFSQLISQTIVLSFYQKKSEPALDLVPSIGVSESHIQFHFYDCEKDVYLLSREMPLFYDDAKKSLNLSTVIATWLVLNHRHLISGTSEEMRKEKFGFHSKISNENLQLFKNDIEMGWTIFKPRIFQDNILLKRYRVLSKDPEVVDAKYPKT